MLPALDVNVSQEFVPKTVTVPVGTTVTWTNQDNRRPYHMITSNDGLFSKQLEYGESFSYAFTELGRFTYRCDLYDMAGVVIVE